MDKNSIIGISLIAAILIGFYFINQPSEKQLAEMRKQNQLMKDSIDRAEKNQIKNKAYQADTLVNGKETIGSTSTNDSARQTELVKNYGPFASAAVGSAKMITLENKKIKVKLSTQGGRPYRVELKDYKKYDSTAVNLCDGEDNVFGFKFIAQNRSILTSNLFFTPQVKDTLIVANDKQQTVSLRLLVNQNQYIEYVYSLDPDSYKLNFKVNFVGLKDILPTNTNSVDFLWQVDAPQLEKGKSWELQSTSVYYKHLDAEVSDLTPNAEKKEENITTKLKWVGFKQQFFSSFLIADNFISSASVKYVKALPSSTNLLRFSSNMTFPLDSKSDCSLPLSIYYGPNHYKTLTAMNLDLEKTIPLGWGIFGWVNRFVVIPIFNFLGGFISNFGLIILLLTIIIKAGLFPLTFKSFLSTAKMKVLKPQVDVINTKYPDKADALKKQQEVMALYKKVGVNPMGGCIPLALQMPFLIAMFRFFPASIELRHQSFLWATDLSAYDSIFKLPFNIPFYGDHVSLFCLLMVGSMYLTTIQNSGQMGDQNSQMPGMKTMMYFMPIMMLFWFNSYSAGLSYYYFIANMITYGQTYVIRKMVNDEALLAELNENSKKPVKKSKFQERLEVMAKNKGIQMPKK